ncbi:MAG TPA: site-specific integrase [Streptosporangiaceae bacterium]|nr:site-specific integrase [Streptosporangiaceae bacterium]
MNEPIFKRCRCRGDDGRDLGDRCPKLRRSDGSWNRRHGTWYFVLELRAGPNGRRRQIRRGGFDTRDDASAARDEAKRKAGRGADPSTRLTTGTFLTGWLESRRDLKQTTRRNYRLIIGTYLVPLLGHVELDQLGGPGGAGYVGEMFATIEQWNTELAAGRPVRKYQRHVGPAAMQRIRACLRVALNDAVDQGLIAWNPAVRVRLAPEKRQRPVVWTGERKTAFWKTYRQRVEDARQAAPGRHVDAFDIWRHMSLRPAPVMVWAPADAGAFLDYASRDRLSALFEVLATTGMRRGEACGLEWADVDLAAAELSVTTERVQVGWHVIEDDPKSEAGRRTVALDKGTVAVLRAHRRRQLADRLAWGDAWTDSGKVFTREDGAALHPAAVTLLFERLSFAAGLPPVGLHALRHGAASYALAAGLDVKLVSDRLGHSTSTLTRDVYTSVLPDVARAAAEAAAAMILRQRAR